MHEVSQAAPRRSSDDGAPRSTGILDTMADRRATVPPQNGIDAIQAMLDEEPLSLAEEIVEECERTGTRSRATTPATATTRSSKATSTSPSCSG